MHKSAEIINVNAKRPSPTIRVAVRQTISRLMPDISQNIKAGANYKLYAQQLFRQSDHPKVLIIGGSVIGVGLQEILANSAITFIETDIAFGPRTRIVCDAHYIPFEDQSFDGVIIQAVLEHVVDPRRCVEEIHRVLQANGIVYAETPFMQQVHMGRFDFTRFTHLGHRRLFRAFEEIESGATGGPGMALAWSCMYFLLSFVTSPALQSLIRAGARVTLFWLKYFDYYLIDKPGSFDNASGYYFMGYKSNELLSDQELFDLYRGIQ
jgi:SAM-dependent methyltransferase